MKKLIIMILVGIILYGIFLLVNRSIPYSESPDLLSADVSVDSIWRLGPATALYDKTTQQFYWFKSYSPGKPFNFDVLKNKKAKIRYMKFLSGPLENRIFWMQVDSVVVFNQVIERDK